MARLDELGSKQAVKDIRKLALGVDASAKRVTQKAINRRQMHASFDEVEVVPYGNTIVVSSADSSLSLEAILAQETRSVNEEVLSELKKELKGVLR